MARPGITYQQVAQAAESLAARGETPSIGRIRQELGSGSHTTIHEHLKHWQRQLAENPRAALPPAVPEGLLPAVEQFWRAAVDQADEAYRQRREALETRMKQADTERQAALSARDRLQSERNDLLQKQETLDRELLAREQALRREREGRLAAESALEEAQRGREAAERQIEQVRQETRTREQRQEQALEDARRDHLQRLHYERERHEAEEARLMRDLDRLRGELTAQRKTLEAVQEQARGRENALRAQLEDSQRARTTALNRQAALEERLRLLEEERDRVRSDREHLEREHHAALRQLESLRGKLARTGARRKALERLLLEKEQALKARQSS